KFVLRAGTGLVDGIAQIGTAKTGDVFVRIAQAKLLDDVAAHTFCGAGRECGDGSIGENLAQAAELAIFRTKLMAPLRDAMGFVNSEKGERKTLEPIHGAADRDTSGREIKQPVLAGG